MAMTAVSFLPLNRSGSLAGYVEELDFGYDDEAQDAGLVIAVPLPAVPVVTIEVSDWRSIRDYVVDQIVARHGRFPRDPGKESGIFKSFVARWEDKAMPIAKMAFEVHQGLWQNAPIGVNRFTKNCDPYFAEVIARTLES